MLEVEASREVPRQDVVPVSASEGQAQGRLAVDVVTEIDRRRAVVDRIEGIGGPGLRGLEDEKRRRGPRGRIDLGVPPVDRRGAHPQVGQVDSPELSFLVSEVEDV